MRAWCLHGGALRRPPRLALPALSRGQVSASDGRNLFFRLCPVSPRHVCQRDGRWPLRGVPCGYVLASDRRPLCRAMRALPKRPVRGGQWHLLVRTVPHGQIRCHQRLHLVRALPSRPLQAQSRRHGPRCVFTLSDWRGTVCQLSWGQILGRGGHKRSHRLFRVPCRHVRAGMRRERHCELHRRGRRRPRVRLHAMPLRDVWAVPRRQRLRLRALPRRQDHSRSGRGSARRVRRVRPRHVRENSCQQCYGPSPGSVLFLPTGNVSGRQRRYCGS